MGRLTEEELEESFTNEDYSTKNIYHQGAYRSPEYGHEMIVVLTFMKVPLYPWTSTGFTVERKGHRGATPHTSVSQQSCAAPMSEQLCVLAR